MFQSGSGGPPSTGINPLAMALLSAGTTGLSQGYSPMPRGRFQGLAQGVQAGMNTYQQALMGNMQMQLQMQQYKDEQERKERLQQTLQGMDLSHLPESQRELIRGLAEFAPAQAIQYGMATQTQAKDPAAWTVAVRRAQATLPPGASEADINRRAAEIIASDKASSGTTVNLNQESTSALNEKVAERDGLFYDTVAESGDQAYRRLANLENLEFALKDQNTGPLAPEFLAVQSGLGQLARRFNIGTQEEIDKLISGNDTDRMELARRVSNELTLEYTGMLAGQISEKELEFAYNITPSIQNTPAGNRAIILAAKESENHRIRRAQYLQSLRGEDGTLPSDFRRKLNAWDEENRIRIENDDGSLTEYGKKLIDLGVIQRAGPKDEVQPPAPPKDMQLLNGEYWYFDPELGMMVKWEG